MIYLKQLTLTETIEELENLIDSGKGDAGRLYHILEFLKNKKPLYVSDQIYLENKLEASFSTEDEEPVSENTLLPKVQKLIDIGNGDPGRLQYIYDMLANNKPLYHSDAIYLDSKSQSLTEESDVVKNKFTTSSTQEHISSPPPKEIPKETIIKVRGSMPKGWTSDDSEESTVISDNIKQEEQKIKQQQKISDAIDDQRSKLTQLISHRKEYEQKVIQEQSSLESQIKDERLKIETQTRLSQEIVTQKEELLKVKKERANVIKKIDSEKLKISKELKQQKQQLVQAQLEQEKIEKQIQNEQILLAEMAKEQKSRLIEQAEIARKIKLKQSDLENTKQDYDEIVSQVNDEKAKFAESEKLKTLIKTQEQDLLKTKEERIHLNDIISNEKELITKKTKEEKERLKSQTLLARQLKKEKKSFESLKKKHDKIEQQIRTKNQKLKEQQEKLKKQIAEKDKKLKSIVTKTTPKKVTKTTPKNSSDKKIIKKKK